MIEIAVCIQIRDGNTRLPGKGSKILHGKPVYKHMIENVHKCVDFINMHSEKKNINAKVWLLVPFDEGKYWEAVASGFSSNISVVTGSKGNNSDVFERFENLFRLRKPNYMVRITGDCPFIPSALINKAINCAVNHRLDYVSNVDERFRTMPDGFDVEVIGDEAFLWLMKAPKSASHKEHVTTFLRENIQKWMRCAVITGVFDTSDYKYSIDTQQDFDNVDSRFGSKIRKDSAARREGLGVYEF